MDFFMCSLCLLINIPGIVIRYIPFSKNIDKKSKTLLFSIYTVILLINTYISLNIYKEMGNYDFWYKYTTIIFPIIILLINIIIIKQRILEHLFLFGVVENFIIIIRSVLMYIQQFFIIDNLYKEMFIITINIMFIFLFGYFFIKKITIDMVKPAFNKESIIYLKKLLIIPAIILVLNLLLINSNKDNIRLSEIVLKIILGAIILIICNSIKSDIDYEITNVKKEISFYKRYYYALSRHIKKIREAKHDLRFHISGISFLVENNNIDNLKDYLKEYKAIYNIEEYIPYTGNPIVDGILYNYIEEAKKYNIKIDINCNCNKLNIRDVDLCSLFGNLLENAITACKEYNGDRFIKIYSESDDLQFILIIDNSFNGNLIKSNGKILSKKRNNQRGVGITSIKAICKKYNGYYEFKAENNIFHSSFILNNKKS